MTQSERVIAYLEQHEGASHMELTTALHIAQITGRISDARRLLAPDRLGLA